MLSLIKYLQSSLPLLVIIVSCSYKSSKLFANAKEIEATSQWTLLEEGGYFSAELKVDGQEPLIRNEDGKSLQDDD